MLQQSQVGYSAPVQYGAPVGAAHGCGEEGETGGCDYLQGFL